jgi:hypothetical protein
MCWIGLAGLRDCDCVHICRSTLGICGKPPLIYPTPLRALQSGWLLLTCKTSAPQPFVNKLNLNAASHWSEISLRRVVIRHLGGFADLCFISASSARAVRRRRFSLRSNKLAHFCYQRYFRCHQRQAAHAVAPQRAGLHTARPRVCILSCRRKLSHPFPS